MRRSMPKPFDSLVPLLLLFLFVLLPWIDMEPARAQKSSPKIPQEEIKISGDLLVSNSNENYAEFRGNVEAIQGDFIIKSDVLRIYYRPDIKLNEKSAAGQETIQKIIATGNVKIWSGKDYAETQSAEYSTRDMILRLKGENSKVISEKISMSASRITLNRATGEIKSERATMTITPDQKKKSK